MALFSFPDSSLLLGTVREVDTKKVSVNVKYDSDLQKAMVGQLVCLEIPGGVETWIIGIIEKVIKSCHAPDTEPDEEVDEKDAETITNTVKLVLVGTTRFEAISKQHVFSRAVGRLPQISAKCHVLKDKQLENFMTLLVNSANTEGSLCLGKYTMDGTAKAYLDGNKFFQRHAALLGSTGSGKSWTVAAILEKAAQLPSANLIAFDLHGEYSELSYARHLKIPSTEELGTKSETLLYLPYWLLNAEEMQAMFVDNNEFTAHNQVMAFQDLVVKEKKNFLQEQGRKKLANTFTLDSPIPFPIDTVIEKLTDLNEEMEQGARGLKQGKFFGQFSRLLMRLRSKLDDKRYGFLFHAPDSEHQYDSMASMAEKLMDCSETSSQIKIIDFSEVPSDILPVIVSLVARIVYQIQFWTDPQKRKPLVLVCDEAHLYLPKKDHKNPVEQRAIEAIEKIAKEGRKYGVALLVVSQRPSDVSATVLSQCNNIVALRLTNGDDQATLKKLMPDSMESLLEVLPIMDIGEALVVGDAVLLPSRIRVEPPEEKPLSATIDFWSEWSKNAKKTDFAESVENMRKQGREK